MTKFHHVIVLTAFKASYTMLSRLADAHKLVISDEEPVTVNELSTVAAAIVPDVVVVML